MSMQAHGTARKFGDHVDTDVIIPARYLASQDPKELASHCMEDIDAAFVQNHNEGDLMVAGWNFGCGSSREHAPIAIKAAGISCVIAKTFARIFYRNAINIGLAILECPAASDGHRGRRRGVRRLRHRRHHERHEARDVSGGAVSAVHQGHDPQRRPDGLPARKGGALTWKRPSP